MFFSRLNLCLWIFKHQENRINWQHYRAGTEPATLALKKFLIVFERRKCLTPVLLLAVPTSPIRKKVLYYIQYLSVGKMTLKNNREVKPKCEHWTPTKYSAVCSKHFRDEDFTMLFSRPMDNNLQRRPKKMQLEFVSSLQNTLLVSQAKAKRTKDSEV